MWLVFKLQSCGLQIDGRWTDIYIRNNKLRVVDIVKYSCTKGSYGSTMGTDHENLRFNVLYDKNVKMNLQLP